MTWFRKILFAAVLMAFAPAQLFACAACGSSNAQIHSPLTDGMNMGILTLMGVLLTMLSVFLVGIIHLIRKSEALNAAAENAIASAAKSPQV